MTELNGERELRQVSAADLRKICLEAGADDAGFVNLDREAVQKEREGILKVYPHTRSIISIIKVMNRENIQGPARLRRDARGIPGVGAPRAPACVGARSGSGDPLRCRRGGSASALP